MRKKEISAILLALWLTIIALFMLFGERFDLGLLFVLGFIGFLVIVELMEPYYVKPNYVFPTRILMAFGFVLVSAIIIQKLLEMLGLEIVMP